MFMMLNFTSFPVSHLDCFADCLTHDGHDAALHVPELVAC